MSNINVQANPIPTVAGVRDSDAVIITPGAVTAHGEEHISYQIEKVVTGDRYRIWSSMTAIEGGNVINVSRTSLKIILESRTKYRVRVKGQEEDNYTGWVSFTTRDKRYQTPDAIYSLTDDSDSTAETEPAHGGLNRTIVVTNNSYATEQENVSVAYGETRQWGPVTVINTDPIYNGMSLQREPGRNRIRPVAYGGRGATVTNVPDGQNNRVIYTDRGATIRTTTNS